VGRICQWLCKQLALDSHSVHFRTYWLLLECCPISIAILILLRQTCCPPCCRIPNDTDCFDPLPTPPPPPPPPPLPPPSCAGTGCHMLGLPSDAFYAGTWTHAFVNITTKHACIVACLAAPQCQQVTWLARPIMPCSEYTSLAGGGWPPPSRIGGVSAFVKCWANETTAEQCNQNPPPPPPPPPPLPTKRKVPAILYRFSQYV
jgi:hypothetical protein